jgi:hypothetical protein
MEKLKVTPERLMESEDMGPLSDLLNINDCSNWDNYDEPELNVVDDEGKPVQPEDYYCP